MDNYIARQPIFSTQKALYGYELLYRDNVANIYPEGLSGDVATQRVLANTLFSFDLHALTKGRVAFVNFTRRLLLAEVPLLLDPSHFTIEILEDVVLDEPLLAALQKYKEAGFTLVLDDYTGNQIPEDFLLLLDIIKVDFRATSREAQQRITRVMKRQHIDLLAEKVEDSEDFTAAVSFGYTLFQGYYFSKPVVLKKNALSIATYSYTMLAKEASQPNLDFKRLAAIIYPDAELTWLLMKKMRTLKYYRGHTVTSLQLALARMGIREVRRWVTLLLLQKVLGREMDELIRLGLIRAVFCEALSYDMDEEHQRMAFASGLFSVIASLDDSFYESLGKMGLGPSLRGALEGTNQLGHCLDVVRAYEVGDWSLVSELLKQFFPHLSSERLSSMYMDAINYSDNITSYT